MNGNLADIGAIQSHVPCRAPNTSLDASYAFCRHQCTALPFRLRVAQRDRSPGCSPGFICSISDKILAPLRLFRRAEANGQPAVSGTCGTPNAVNVAWIGQLVVNNQLQRFNVQPACGEVATSTRALRSRSEQRLVTIALFRSPCNDSALCPAAFRASHCGNLFGITKHHAGGGLVLAQQFLQKRDFALLRGFKELLLDGGQAHPRCRFLVSGFCDR